MFKKRLVCIMLIIATISALCTGCQTSPGEESVINKNPHSELVSSQTDPHEFNLDALPNPTQLVDYNNSFVSTDGSVNFTLDIHNAVPSASPVVFQVEPRFLTAADAKRVAETMFPDSVFYEAEPERDSQYSKSEIQEKLTRWSPYLNPSAVENLYGDSAYADTTDVVSSFIEQYTLMYETAPDSNPHTPCAWEMRKASEYMLPAEELAQTDLSNDSDAVSVQFRSNNIPYLLTVTTRDKSDFKVNMIACSIYDGLCPVNLDERIFTAQLCRTETPTQSQLDSVKQHTEDLLASFDLGKWEIDECFVSSEVFGSQEEYCIHVNAVPAFDNAFALRRPQLTGLRSKDGYAPKQYFSDVQFVFAPNGELLSFTLTTPLNIQDTLSKTSMDMDTLLTRAQELLTLTDSFAYGLGDLAQYIPEEAICNVTVSEMKCGHSRIKVPNQDNCYYYVPSIALYGTAENVGTQTGKTYYCSDQPEFLFLINALDGSVINDTNA